LGGGFVQCGQGGVLQMRTSTLLDAKNFGFSKFKVCATDKGGGDQFFAILCGRPLTAFGYCCIKEGCRACLENGSSQFKVDQLRPKAAYFATISRQNLRFLGPLRVSLRRQTRPKPRTLHTELLSTETFCRPTCVSSGTLSFNPPSMNLKHPSAKLSRLRSYRIVAD